MDHVLVVDDDIELCELVGEYLKSEGFEIEAVDNGDDGVERALSGAHSLVVLDVMLPGINGFEALRRIRAKSQIPVLMLTARGEDVDRIVGLEIGADDYLPKPFNPRELSARLRAILRRVRAPDMPADGSTESELRQGDLVLDRTARSVSIDGIAIDVTATEFAVLDTLVQARGGVVGKDELSKQALGRRWMPSDRSLDTHVSNLRRKLGSRGDGSARIKTLRGQGYLFLAQQRRDEVKP